VHRRQPDRPDGDRIRANARYWKPLYEGVRFRADLARAMWDAEMAGDESILTPEHGFDPYREARL
jgi:hypothetical protein